MEGSMMSRFSAVPFNPRALARLPAAIRRRGVSTTVRALALYVADATFDVSHGVRTISEVTLRRLDVDDHSKQQAHGYRPVRAASFQAALRSFKVPTDGVFVDFGCGKGRALILALDHGFRGVVGVELSAALCDVARRNLAVYRARSGNGASARVVQGDAGRYAVGADDRVFFFYDPFGPDVMRQVVDNIERSYHAQPRPLHLLYTHPVHRDVVEARAFWSLVRDRDFLGIGQTLLYRAG
jgi:SAM-dependent methyltransferase